HDRRDPGGSRHSAPCTLGIALDALGGPTRRGRGVGGGSRGRRSDFGGGSPGRRSDVGDSQGRRSDVGGGSRERRLALHVHVSPEHARVFLDGEELPLAARNGGLRARDGRPHLLLAEAEGYQPRSQTLLFNSDDVALDIMLAKQAPHAAPGASAPGRPAHRRGPRPLAAPTRKPGRPPSGGQASAPPAGVQAPAPPSGGPEELGRPPPSGGPEEVRAAPPALRSCISRRRRAPRAPYDVAFRAAFRHDARRRIEDL
nr:hypothetical protein [Polyangiaceae bacterium]